MWCGLKDDLIGDRIVPDSPEGVVGGDERYCHHRRLRAVDFLLQDQVSRLEIDPVTVVHVPAEGQERIGSGERVWRLY